MADFLCGPQAMLELRTCSTYEPDTLLKGDELEQLVRKLYECRGAAKTKEFDAAIRHGGAALALSVTTRDSKIDPRYVVDALKRMEISAKDPAAQLAIAHVVLNTAVTTPDVARDALLRRRTFSRLCGLLGSDAAAPNVAAVLARALAHLALVAANTATPPKDPPSKRPPAAARALSFEATALAAASERKSGARKR